MDTTNRPTRQPLPEARTMLVGITLRHPRYIGRQARPNGWTTQHHLADDAIDGRTLCGLRLGQDLGAAEFVRTFPATERTPFALTCGTCANRIHHVEAGTERVVGRSNRES